MAESTNEHSPLVSVITVTFNAANTLPATMKSVGEQTADDYEHIVMDGKSTDETITIANRLSTPRTVIHSSPDNGIYDAMNKALHMARGRYLLFLNAGDRFADADTLARFIRAINENPCAQIIYGQTLLVDYENNILGPRHLRAPESLTFNSFKNGMSVCHQAFMVSRDIAPLYDLQYRFSADYDWCIRCLKMSAGNFYLGDEPVIHYLHEGLTTANHKRSLKERYRIMCRFYGTLPTLFRHCRFALRYLGRRKNAINNQ